MEIQSAGLSDLGKKREINEDSFFLNDRLHVYAVADGMGGHQAGEVASGIVAETVEMSMDDFASGRSPDPVADADPSLSLEGNRLLAAIRAANTRILESAQGNPGRQGMGSTVAAVSLTDFAVISANVGDSPIFLVRNGAPRALSMTHTVLAELQAVAPERVQEIDQHYHHMLSRAVGVEAKVEPDVFETPHRAGDVVVLCSDGLSNKVTSDEMAQIVSQASPQEACRVLVGLANGRGGDDNITVIVIKIGQSRSTGWGPLRFLARLLARFRDY